MRFQIVVDASSNGCSDFYLRLIHALIFFNYPRRPGVIFSYTYICWIHTDAINKDVMIKTQEETTHEGRRRKEGTGRNSLTIFYLSLYL